MIVVVVFNFIGENFKDVYSKLDYSSRVFTNKIIDGYRSFWIFNETKVWRF
jgi:hypothetical protein